MYVYVIFSAPPGPPNVMAQTIGPDMVLVVVTPSPSGGLTTSYNVTISNSSYTTSRPVDMTSGSAMVTFTGLRNDSSYNISAVAINCAGNSSTSIQRYISCMYTCTYMYPCVPYMEMGYDTCIYGHLVIILCSSLHGHL